MTWIFAINLLTLILIIIFFPRIEGKAKSYEMPFSSLKSKQFIIATEIKETLLSINQYFDIDMDTAKDIDRFHTDMLLNCFHRQALIETNYKFNRFQAIDIQGHKVYLIFDKIGDNKYKVSNYFSDTVEISCSFNDIPIQTSQFSLLDAQGFIDATNIPRAVLSRIVVSVENSEARQKFAY